MLTVYTYRAPRPPRSIDLSTVPLDDIADTIQDICAHQKGVRLWFGYIDGWMLNPREEVLLRTAIRKFQCFVVTAFPLALSQAWKMEVDTIYTEIPHGDSDTDHNGRAVHDGGTIEYGTLGSRASSERTDHQD
jgi:hypothetical protein